VDLPQSIVPVKKTNSAMIFRVLVGAGSPTLKCISEQF
jgi:hypothetical protein